MQRLAIGLMLLSVVVAGCNRGTDDTTTTTTDVILSTSTTTTTTIPLATDDGTDDPDDGAVEPSPAELPGYSIVRREGAEGGDRLVVLLEEAEYTDLILEDLVGDITEVYAPVLEAYLIDDPSAADLVLLDPATLSEADQEILAMHLFVSVTEGTLVTFHGPFADTVGFRLGS